MSRQEAWGQPVRISFLFERKWINKQGNQTFPMRAASMVVHGILRLSTAAYGILRLTQAAFLAFRLLSPK